MPVLTVEAVTYPVMWSTKATFSSLMLHLPPEGVDLYRCTSPWQSIGMPVMGVGIANTSTVLVCLQPCDVVNVTVSVPALKPVNLTEFLVWVMMFRRPDVPMLHVPPAPNGFSKRISSPTHIVSWPVIGPGKG